MNKFLFLLSFLTPVFTTAQTNILSTNPYAEQVLLGNYSPSPFVTYPPADPAEMAQALEAVISADSLKSYILKLATFKTRNSGSDTIDGAAGDDVAFGGKDNDLVVGRDGNDRLRGDRGNDSVTGDNGNDLLFGGKGLDLLFGGSGNDTISGDLAQDTLIGGSGNDLFFLRQNGAPTDVAFADSIADFEIGIDAIGLSGGLTAANLRLDAVDCNTVIRVADSGQVLAVVNSVKPEQILGSFVTANITLI